MSSSHRIVTLAINHAARYYRCRSGRLGRGSSASALSGRTPMPKRSKLSTTTAAPPLKPISPGEMLAEEFLKPLGMSNYRLAKEIGVPAQRIGDILAGKRAITADTDLRLCRFFGLSNGWWLRLQADYDTEIARAALAKTLAKIRPWTE